MDVLKKTPVREQDAKVRATNFEEVCYGYNKEELMNKLTLLSRIVERVRRRLFLLHSAF